MPAKTSTTPDPLKPTPALLCKLASVTPSAPQVGEAGTPRTDAKCKDYAGPLSFVGDEQFLPASFARQLEQELNAERHQREDLWHIINQTDCPATQLTEALEWFRAQLEAKEKDAKAMASDNLELCDKLEELALLSAPVVQQKIPAHSDDKVGEPYAQWSLEARLRRQENLTSALWGFAHDLQHEKHNAKSADGTTVNLEAVGRAQEIILRIFSQKPQDIQ